METLVGVPIGKNGALVPGKLTVSPDGRSAEWKPNGSDAVIKYQRTLNEISPWRVENGTELREYLNTSQGTNYQSNLELYRQFNNGNGRENLNNALLQRSQPPTPGVSQTPVNPTGTEPVIPVNPNVAKTDPNSQNNPSGGPVPLEVIPSSTPATPSSYTYPANIDPKQDCIRFRIFQLKKNPNADIKDVPGILDRTGGGKEGFGVTADEKSYTADPKSPFSIILPIQASIIDQNLVNWGGGELNELQRILAKASVEGMGTNGDIAKAFETTLSSIFGSVQNYPDQYKNILYGSLLEQAVNAPGLTARLFGGVLNPNMELLFQGPQLRPFNFTFKMSPRSKPEADIVKKIIRAFKRNMAPKVNGIFLQAPNVFKIEYLHGNKEVHKSINLIKMCSLQNCSVDYTPLQTYMTFDDGPGGDPEASMVSYNMSLTFSEITPIYQDDYDAKDVMGHLIGF